MLSALRQPAALLALVLAATASPASAQSLRAGAASPAPVASPAAVAAPVAVTRAPRGSVFGRRVRLGSALAGRPSVPQSVTLGSLLRPGSKTRRARPASAPAPVKVARPARPVAAAPPVRQVRRRHAGLVPPIEGPLPVVSTNRPGLVMLMVDCSESMEDEIAGVEGVSKAQAAAEATNNVILELALAHRGGDGSVRDRLQVGQIQYGGGSAEFGLAEGPLPLGRLARHPTGFNETEQDGERVRTPYWVEPSSGGNTPMHEAFDLARQSVEEFLDHADRQRGERRPRLVLGLNITDGQPSYDPTDELVALATEATRRGDAFLMTNVHVTGDPRARPILFPTAEQARRFDEYGRALFEMSSPVPDALLPLVRELNPSAVEGTRPRMMAVNANVEGLNSIIRVGSSLAMTAGR